jgi:hypothetical protein
LSNWRCRESHKLHIQVKIERERYLLGQMVGGEVPMRGAWNPVSKLGKTEREIRLTFQRTERQWFRIAMPGTY